MEDGSELIVDEEQVEEGFFNYYYPIKGEGKTMCALKGGWFVVREVRGPTTVNED